MNNQISAPQLHLDVLLSVAEKLLFSPDNDFRMDLRDPNVNADIINFMFAGPACRWAFFTQFKRLTKVCINITEVQLSSPTLIQGVRGSVANTIEFFQGPFVVNEKFFYALLSHGVLQPKIIHSFFKFGLKASNSGSSINTASGSTMFVEDIINESAAESFVRLFLFKDSSNTNISKDDFIYCNLKLDAVKIHDDTTVFKHIGRILNLDAENLHFEISSEITTCVSNFTWTKVNSKRTKSVTLSYTFDIVESSIINEEKFPFDEFLTLLYYIADCCHNLESLVVNILLSGEFSDEDFKVISHWLEQTIKELIFGKLPHTDFFCDLTISFRAYFPEATLMEANKSNHPLVQLGGQHISLDGLGNIVTDLPDTYTIAKEIQIRKQPLTRVIYSLIGIEEDSTNNDWDGFHGQLQNANHPVVPFPGFAALDYALAAINQPLNHEHNSDESD